MGTLARDFEDLRSDVVNMKSEKYATWTDASLFPDGGYENTRAGSTDPISVCRDWQSFGQQIINYAASKTMQELFPIGRAFFTIEMGGAARADAVAATNVKPEDLQGALVTAANDASQRIHWRGNYSRVAWGLKVLYVTGNLLLFKRADGSIIAYTTRNYSIKRDGAGDPLKLVLKERHAYRMLPEEVQAGFPDQRNPDEQVDVYTGVEWQPAILGAVPTVQVWQEAGTWKSEKKSYDSTICPFLPLVVDLIPGESYGRGRVEANAGDFARYSELSRALTLYEIESCKVVKGVAPGSGADLEALQAAESGEYVQADPDAVKPIEFGDARKIAELRGNLQAIETRLSRAFGWGANMRDAERVTAYEVAQSAAEIDTVQGGLYSQLSYSLHLPLALLFLQDTHPEILGVIRAGKADIGIVTGIPALGRNSAVRALLQASQEASVIATALTGISARFSGDKIADAAIIAAGYDPAQIERSEEELQAQAQATAPLNPADPQNLTNAIQGVIASG